MQTIYLESWKGEGFIGEQLSLSSHHIHADKLMGKWGFNFEHTHLSTEVIKMQKAMDTSFTVFSSNSRGTIPSEDQQQDFIARLPPELLEKIFILLSASDLAKFLSISRSWNRAAQDMNAWSILFRRDFRFAYHRLLSIVQALPASQQKEIKWPRAYAEWSLSNEPWCQQQALEGHTEEITCLAPLADSRIATGSHDNTVRIWSLNGEEPIVLNGHTSVVNCLAPLADGRIATGSYDETVRIWSLNLDILMEKSI